ncbi:hypothetical protein [Demequina litorisediminis]|uniref:Uncharacterized protein n=1 Tax=Demequina litorisediminis TaxID=1849022 RepID=A0ABQ6IBP7_9MICO|nr:hypothetical protein [Demequina litorisediminis]GMA35229.1 hypothetical protein GCM10025876_14330 [Demequina litorisediminis]
MLWWASGGIDLVYPLAAAGGALVWGACVGGWPMRAAGIAAAIAMAVVASAAFDVPEEVNPDAVAPTKDEAWVRYREAESGNWSSDAPGATLAYASSYGGPSSAIVTDAGGVVLVRQTLDSPSADNADRFACWMIADPNPGVVEPERGSNTLTAADCSDACAVDEDGAHRLDGLGYSRREGLGYVIVTSGEADRVVSDDDGTAAPPVATRAGTADDVAAVVEGLRPINDAELRRLFEDSWALSEEGG